ncbi:MAG: leucine-rich repeat domain-containing protein [Clostridia bacterium]|nr:leucine-rich repeat domain-containing protein [Clostridia bacterium]
MIKKLFLFFTLVTALSVFLFGCDSDKSDNTENESEQSSKLEDSTDSDSSKIEESTSSSSTTEHTHIFSDAWEYDQSSHFQKCIVEGCSFKSEANHVFTSSTKDPDCENDGETAYSCECGFAYSDPITKLGHTAGEASCLEAYICERCSKEISEALGHDIKHHDAQAPSCIDIGWNEYDTCTRCDYSTYSEIEATGHSGGEATCTEQAICDICQTSYGEVLGHDEITHEGQAAGCISIGWNEYVTCSRCDYSSYIEIGAIGHSYIERVCENCGDILPSEGLEFQLSSDETYYYVVGRGACTDKDVVIPSSYEGLPVTAIGGMAFQDDYGIYSLVVPSSVTEIEYRAFLYCSNLNSITLPDTLTYIGWQAFASCGYYNNSSNWENGILYIDKYLILADRSVWGDVTVKEGTLGIATRGFEGAKEGLTSVILPDSLKFIGASAFYECTELSYVEFGNSLLAIRTYAFKGCTSLKSFTLPASLEFIEYDAFPATLASVVFENPNGWVATGYKTTETFSSDRLSNKNTAAKYLGVTYSGYDWKRK